MCDFTPGNLQKAERERDAEEEAAADGEGKRSAAERTGRDAHFRYRLKNKQCLFCVLFFLHFNVELNAFIVLRKTSQSPGATEMQLIFTQICYNIYFPFKNISLYLK